MLLWNLFRARRGGMPSPFLALLAAACLAAASGLRAYAGEAEIGLNFTASTLFESGSYPPDSMMAVGDAAIVELINGRFAVYRKSDGSLLRSRTLYEFWLEAGIVPRTRAFDPRILYDARTGRWFALSVDGAVGPNHFLVAVSASSDPLAGWTGFQIPSDSDGDVWADFPMLGINDYGVFASANMFNFSDVATGEASVLVLPKEDLLAAAPSVANATLFEDVPAAQVGFTPQPVVDLDGSSPFGILLSNTLGATLVRADLRGDVFSPVLSGGRLIAIEGFGAVPLGPQPGPKPGLEASLVEQIQTNAILRDGSIWAVNTVGVDGRPALRWLQIDAETSEIRQTGVLADEALGFYYGSIAVNEFGDVVVGCTGSSESRFASSYAFVGETRDGVTTFGEPILLKAGVSDYAVVFGGRNRWGDYSATVVDPSDPRRFWTIQEFVVDTDVWATQITELRVGPSVPVELDVTIDIKPGSDRNVLRCGRPQILVPVAILSTPVFDAGLVDHASVRFEGAAELHVTPDGAPRRHEEDVDGDGDLDLVLHFRLGETALECAADEAVLRGTTFDGHDIQGRDELRWAGRPE